MKPSLDIKKVLVDGHDTLKAQWRVLLPVVFFAWLFSAVASFGVDTAGPFGIQVGPELLYPLYNIFGLLSYILLSLVVSIGLMFVFLKTVEGKKLERGDMLEGFTFKKLFSFIGAYIIYSLLVLIGLLLFIVPGIYIAVALIPLFYVIVDKNVGPIRAIKETYQMTKDHWWHVLGVTITTGLIVFAVTLLMIIVLLLGAWVVVGLGSIATAVLLAIAIPAFLIVILFIQSYIGLTHAFMYKELRDHKG